MVELVVEKEIEVGGYICGNCYTEKDEADVQAFKQWQSERGIGLGLLVLVISTISVVIMLFCRELSYMRLLLQISLYLLFGLYIGYFYITIDYEKICYTCHKRECVLKDTDAGQELVERKRDGGNR